MAFKKVKQDITHGGTNNDTFIDNSLTFYDGEKITSVEGTKVTTEGLHVDDLDVDRLTTLSAVIKELEVNGDTILNGNLTVKGTHTEEHSQDLYVGSDTITLRDGSTTALENGEYAGLIIEKVDGNNAIGLVTTNDGTLKVGYLNLVYVYTTLDESSEKYGKYYSDSGLTNEVEVKGQVFIESKDDDLAKGYFIDKDETQVIATRDDSDDLNDGTILYFDKEKYKLVDSGVTTTQLNDLVDSLLTLKGDDKIIITNPIVEKHKVEGTDLENFCENSGFFEERNRGPDGEWEYPLKEGVSLEFEGYSIEQVVIFGNIIFLHSDLPYYSPNDTFDFTFTYKGTSIKLNDDNKVYTYDTLEEAQADLDNIPNKAIVHVIGDLNSESIAIVDEVKEGDYNVPTSDALFNYLKNYSESINGTFVIDDWTLKVEGE